LHVTPGDIFTMPLTHTQRPFRSQQSGFAGSLVQSDGWAQTCSVSVALQLAAKLVEQPATHFDENDCLVQFGGLPPFRTKYSQQLVPAAQSLG
jgi:hypothetical protein